MAKIDKKTGQRLYPVSREFIQFNLISMIDEVHPKLGATPNADLYWEIHDLDMRIFEGLCADIRDLWCDKMGEYGVPKSILAYCHNIGERDF